MSAEVCEFLSAIDDYRRANMRSFLSVEEILRVLDGLGYSPGDGGHRDERATAALTEAVEEYKQKHERLFPSWSEIFEVARGLGWDR